ncbi:MAG: hypothetical protein Q8Q40_16150 [Methylococcaceae bacterium]|nr:hypothetical protein [Methylococcaceae bacterium]MDP3905486.1 hypothetical protein [Methylococcaceae bacterium]
MSIGLILQWAVIIGIPLAIMVFLLMRGRRYRTDIFLVVGDKITTVSQHNGRVLLRLSNQLVTLGSGRKERIIAVGRPGEFGFPYSPPLPPDARICDLLEAAIQDTRRGKLLWRQFLRYCGAVGIKEVRETDLATTRALPVSRVFIHSTLKDARVESVLKKAVGRYWLSGDAPQLVLHNPTI